ncbi:hypothetical protein C7212DRAFT_71272, partial [Tuber magnatum]
PVCRGAPLTQVQRLWFPQSAAQVGLRVWASYAENRHVSKLRTGDPVGNRGAKFWYGTKDPVQWDKLYRV